MKKVTIDLTKIYLKQSFSSFYSSKKDTPFWKSLILGCLLFIVVAFSLGSSFWGMAEQLHSANLSQMVLVLGLLFSTFFTLMFTIYEQQGSLRNNKDQDLLLSMPIKKIQIVLARFFNSYCFSLLFSLTTALPAFVVYFCFQPITWFGIVFALISIFLIPSFTLLVGSIFGFLINICTKKLKNKNIFNTIFSIIFTIALVVLVSIAPQFAFSSLFADGNLPVWMQIIFPHISFLFKSVTSGSFIFFVFFVLVSFVFFFLCLSFNFLSISKTNNTTSSSKKKKPLIYEKRSMARTFLKKEAKTFFEMPIYCTNCMIGAFLCVVISIVLSLMFKSSSTQYNLNEYYTLIFAFTSMMCFGVSLPTYVTFNVEGQNIQNLKNLPISFSNIALAKILFSCILFTPFILISNIIFPIVLEVNNILLIFFSLLSQIFALIAFSTAGLYINLKNPKLDWSSETQAVKQSISVFYSMLLSFMLTLIPLVLISIFPQILIYIDSWLILLIHSLLSIAVFSIFVILIKTKGEKLYKKL